MLFPTLSFALFFIGVFLISWSLRKWDEWRKAFLVFASYVFYAQWDERFILLLLLSSILNYYGGLKIFSTPTERARKLWLGGTIAVNLGILGYFKYSNFFIESLDNLLRSWGSDHYLPLLQIALPVGISFFTFHGISYVVDIYRGQIVPHRKLIDLLLYIAFFPQLVAGPILRASYFMPQLERAPDPLRIRFGYCSLLILGGLFKKVVIANSLAEQLVDPAFFDPALYGPYDLLLATYGYAVQIYCDFSAYTDIATGVAGLLGYRFPPNFNQPYRATSMQDFWRRWHISLSSWLRDYLYIPLGGNRGSVIRRDVNLLLTMFLGGIWHGAAWTFVLWGVFHGLALVLERHLKPILMPLSHYRGMRILGILVTFHLVCFAWLLFRAGEFSLWQDYMMGFFEFDAPLQLASPYVAALIAGTLLMQFLPPDLSERGGMYLARLPVLVQGASLGAAIAIIDAIGPEGVAPFIYFQF